MQGSAVHRTLAERKGDRGAGQGSAVRGSAVNLQSERETEGQGRALQCRAVNLLRERETEGQSVQCSAVQ